MRTAGLIATVSGALLVVSLYFTWWGPPGVFVDPPSGLPPEIEFMAQGYQDSGGAEFVSDAFEFFELRDVAWLVTGISGFLLGLALLTDFRLSRPLAAGSGSLALLSVVLISLVLISPPDILELSADRGAPPLGIDFDLPLSREIGGFVALVASCGVLVASVLALRVSGGLRARTSARSPRA